MHGNHPAVVGVVCPGHCQRGLSMDQVLEHHAQNVIEAIISTSEKTSCSVLVLVVSYLLSYLLLYQIINPI